MYDIIVELYGGLGLSIIDIIILCTVLGGLLFTLEDVRIGLMIYMFLFFAEFAIFYELGYASYYKCLIAMFVSLVLLVLSLMISMPKSTRLSII